MATPMSLTAPQSFKKCRSLLKAAVLYQDEENGILDDRTIKAIGEFQEKRSSTIFRILCLVR